MRRYERAISWGLPLLTLGVYVILVAVLGTKLIELADGQMPFDTRVFGYDMSEVRRYLAALRPEGYVLAQGPVLWVDTLFPALLGLCFAWWMRPYHGAFGMVCVLSAMSYVALDWGENAAVQRLLTAGPDWVTLADVMRASVFTQAKFAAVALCAVLALRQIWRRRGAMPTHSG